MMNSQQPILQMLSGGAKDKNLKFFTVKIHRINHLEKLS
jgi:hypothetical protein